MTCRRSDQIFGTDVSEAALQKARAGVYHSNVLHEVSAERLERFFARQNGEYRITKEVRDVCLFARQDVTRDPPFSRLDLISCRNLLIYLDEVAQRRVLRTFHYALRPQGMLFLVPRRASPSRLSCSSRSTAACECSVECRTPAGIDRGSGTRIGLAGTRA
jgi:chemotaxis methyl-accepting protein methylase